MITVQSIEKIYGQRISRKFRICLEKYIHVKEVQGIIQKALNYNLSDSDYKWLYSNGQHPDDRKRKGPYPGLNYICVTFIHPLTKVQSLITKYEKLARS